MIYLRRIGLYLLVLFVVICACELGFYFQKDVNHKNIYPNSKKTSLNKTILVITDSSLGDMALPDTALGSLDKRIDDELPEYSLEAVAVKGLTSNYVDKSIKKLLSDYHPKVVVLLMGHSDFVLSSGFDQTLKEKIFQILDSSYIWRFLKNLIYETKRRIGEKIFYSDIILSPYYLQKKFHDKNDKKFLQIKNEKEVYDNLSCEKKVAYAFWLVVNNYKNEYQSIQENLLTCDTINNKVETNFLFAQIYLLTNNLNAAALSYEKVFNEKPHNKEVIGHLLLAYLNTSQCSKLFPIFEESLKNKSFLVQNFWITRECFIRYEQFNHQNDGYVYFSNLAKKYPVYENYLHLMANTLIADHDKILPVDSTDVSWDFYLSLLFHFKYSQNEEGMNNIFIKKNDFTQNGVSGLGVNQKAYRRVLDQALSSGAYVIVVKYPNKPDFYLDKVIDPYLENIEVLNLSDEFRYNKYRYNISELFEDDLFHFTQKGHAVSSDAIFNKLKKVLQKDLDE